MPALIARSVAALCGVLAAGGAIAAGEVVAAFAHQVPSPVASVGRVIIDMAPFGVRERAIEALGRADKSALVLGTVVIAIVLGGALGLLGRRHQGAAMSAFATFGAAGLLAAQSDPSATLFGGAVAAAIGVASGVGLLWTLLGAANRSAAADANASEVRSTRAPVRKAAQAQAAASLERRHFFRTAGLTVGGVLVGGSIVASRGIGGSRAASTSVSVTPGPSGTNDLALPPVPAPLPPVPASASLDVAGISPLITPNADFYRIDTALVVPRIDATTWSMKVDGMVDRPFSINYQDLRAMPQIERDVTLSCVSNEVGGDLVGTARFQGVLLKDVLERAGVQAGAEQVVGYSVDGFTAGFPIEAALDGRETMIAIGMNGEPLPRNHGYPVRLVVPGLYGYVSATKWLARIRITTMSAVDGYWIPRGWSKLGPIKTESRIDVPLKSRMAAGRIPIAGVAWAPTRGISKVEVQVDNGPWNVATLGEGIGARSWTQWSWAWDAPIGRHVVRCRATDGTGETQTAEVADVAPNGASGYHARRITIE